jgi:hypothetical protein
MVRSMLSCIEERPWSAIQARKINSNLQKFSTTYFDSCHQHIAIEAPYLFPRKVYVCKQSAQSISDTTRGGSSAQAFLIK